MMMKAISVMALIAAMWIFRGSLTASDGSSVDGLARNPSDDFWTRNLVGLDGLIVAGAIRLS